MRCLILIIALLLTGCATTPTSVDTLDGLTVQKGVVSIPYSRNNGGLFIVNVELLGTQANFLLDTGATRSSIFADFYEKYSMGAKDEGMVNVHGLVNSGTRPLTEIPELKLGALGFEKLVVAILPERIDVSYGPESVKLSGLLGMDIFFFFFHQQHTYLFLIIFISPFYKLFSRLRPQVPVAQSDRASDS